MLQSLIALLIVVCFILSEKYFMHTHDHYNLGSQATISVEQIQKLKNLFEHIQFDPFEERKIKKCIEP